MPAIARFQEGLTEVRSLLTLDNSAHTELPDQTSMTEPGIESTSIGATVRRAAVVLLVSHFEGFLKSLGEDLVDSLASGAIETRNIPRGVREAHIIPRLSEIVDCGNETQRFALLGKLSSISHLWNDTAKPPRGTLRAEIVTRRITNADSECIESFFSMFGINDVCNGELDIPDGPDSVGESHDIRTRLRDIVKCRNDVAHGDMERQPTIEDVSRYVTFLQYFAQRLQRRADRFIEQVSATLP